MYRVTINQPDSFQEFRDAARGLIAGRISPDEITWQAGAHSDLFGNIPPPRASQSFSVPAGYVPLAEDAICHCDPARFAHLYALLWRLTHGERTLLLVTSDPLVHPLRLMQKSVRRDIHKMTTFVRFRR